MKSEDVLQLFKEKGALLEGHFELSSGKHSEFYLQCALILQHPSAAQTLAQELAKSFVDMNISAVMGPALGGVIVAHELARALGVRAMFAERKDGALMIRRGFELSRGENVVLVEDVVTTAGSIIELAKLIERAGANICAYASLIDRREQTEALKIVSLAKVEFPIYDKQHCPLCQKGSVAVKPGSKL